MFIFHVVKHTCAEAENERIITIKYLQTRQVGRTEQNRMAWHGREDGGIGEREKVQDN